MPFFFILPVWILALVVGIVMICIRRLRRAGIYVVSTSTFATIGSFVLSTVALMVGAQLYITASLPGWFAFIVLAVYLLAIALGGIAGAAAGVLITNKALARRITT
jgi:hypothetical protein